MRLIKRFFEKIPFIIAFLTLISGSNKSVYNSKKRLYFYNQNLVCGNYFAAVTERAKKFANEIFNGFLMFHQKFCSFPNFTKTNTSKNALLSSTCTTNWELTIRNIIFLILQCWQITKLAFYLHDNQCDRSLNLHSISTTTSATDH